MNLIIKGVLFFIMIVLVFFIYIQTTNNNIEIPGTPFNIKETDENIGDKAEERIQIVDGYKAIQLDKNSVLYSGIIFQTLSKKSIKPEFIAYAEVMDISPLVNLRSDYLNLIAEKKIIQSDLYNKNEILNRAETLHKTQSISTRDLEEIRAERDLKVSELAAIQTRIDNFKYKISSNWGDVIGQLLLDQDKQKQFDQLASHQAFLVLISLLKDQTITSTQQRIFVSNVNERDTANPVMYIDHAKKVTNPVYGESYIYLLNASRLSAGMQLFAWIEESGDQEEGFFVPDNAVIWYANEPWIYIKHENLFVRKPLGKARKIKDGWLTTELISADERVVIQGGQTLLSEEFKWAIPDEEDD